ncbi:MAG: MerC domain-containing protein [Planctomycetota bacterium]
MVATVQELSIVDAKESVVSTGSIAGDAAFGSRTGAVVPDWLGVVASVACAIHCAAMPFVITFLPMLGLSFLADEAFHKVMVGVCTALALLAFVPGWRVHRRWLPAGIAMAGLTMIGAAAFALEDTCACCTLPQEAAVVESEQAPVAATACTDEHCEHCAAKAKASEAAETEAAEAGQPQLLAGITPWVTPLGGLLLVAAHLVNRRFSCRCGCCPTETAGA